MTEFRSQQLLPPLLKDPLLLCFSPSPFPCRRGRAVLANFSFLCAVAPRASWSVLLPFLIGWNWDLWTKVGQKAETFTNSCLRRATKASLTFYRNIIIKAERSRLGLQIHTECDPVDDAGFFSGQFGVYIAFSRFVRFFLSSVTPPPRRAPSKLLSHMVVPLIVFTNQVGTVKWRGRSQQWHRVSECFLITWRNHPRLRPARLGR